MTLPLVILGGSDGRPPKLPTGVREHPLCGYKGVDIRLHGRPLVAALVDRLRACGGFDPILLVGPERIYAGVAAGVRLIDSDGSVGCNVRAALREHTGGEIAFTACDILPDPDELRALLDDYRSQRPADVWFPLIRAPRERERLGAFAWKPEYRIAPTTGNEPVAVLPSHLLIADPAALRLRFLYSLLDLAYRTRNRSVQQRRMVFLTRVIGGLLRHDLLHVLSLRTPSLTWSILRNGLAVARALRRGDASAPQLEQAIGRIVLRSRHRRHHPERGVRLPILDGLSLAEDFDTSEEVASIGGRFQQR